MRAIPASNLQALVQARFAELGSSLVSRIAALYSSMALSRADGASATYFSLLTNRIRRHLRTPERFVRSIKEECLSRVIPFGERHLRRTVREYIEHYHRERNHQGIANALIVGASASIAIGGIRRRPRLGYSITTNEWRDR
jgi:hypothetical protein